MFEGQQNEIFDRLNTGWASTSKIKWPGVAFKHGNADYISVEIENDPAETLSAGKKVHREMGSVVLGIFIFKGANKGIAIKARQWANTLAGVFRNKSGNVTEPGGRTGTMIYRSPTLFDAGEQSNHYEMTLRIPWKIDFSV